MTQEYLLPDGAILVTENPGTAKKLGAKIETDRVIKAADSTQSTETQENIYDTRTNGNH